MIRIGYYWVLERYDSNLYIKKEPYFLIKMTCWPILIKGIEVKILNDIEINEKMI